MTVSFTNAVGNRNGYLLIYKIGSSPTNGAPVDGTTYTVGTRLGGGTGAKGASPFALSGLLTGQQYFFDIYSYNGAGGGINYLQSINPLEGSAWTIEAAPSAQPTSLIFNSITPSGLNGAFIAASPVPTGGYIGLRNTVNGATDLPIDGTAYSIGNTIGTSVVAFMGPSLSFSEGSLTSATTYYYRIFSVGQIFDPSSANYYTFAQPLSNSQITLAPPASAQASNIAFSGATNSQLTLNWTNGNGGRRIVLAHAGSTVNSNSTYPSLYTANAVFGSGSQIGIGNFVVSDGTANSVTVTGLTASTIYYFEVFEYNGVGPTANYLTTTASGNPANQTTLALPGSTQATNILFSGVSNSQMSLTWTNGSGARRVVLGHLGTAVNSNPANGTPYNASSLFSPGDQIGIGNYVIYDGTGTTVTLTGLSPSTVYDFQVFEYNGTLSAINYLIATAIGNPGGQTTYASPVTVQAKNIFFGNITSSSMTVGWTKGNGSRRIVLVHAGANINSYPLAITGYTASPVFGSGTLIGTGNFVVYDGTDSLVTVTGLSGAIAYYFEVFEYNGSGPTANYLTTVAAVNPSNQISLAVPPVTQATNIVFSAISKNQFTIGWTPGSGTNRLVLVQAGAQSNDVIANATNYSANASFGFGAPVGSHFVVYNGTGNSVTISNLLPSTFYYVEVFEYNGAGVTTNYLSTVAFGNFAYQSTLANPAATQASGLTFPGISNNQVTLTWTNGSGTNRMILAHANSAVDSNPLNSHVKANQAIFLIQSLRESLSIKGLWGKNCIYSKRFCYRQIESMRMPRHAIIHS